MDITKHTIVASFVYHNNEDRAENWQTTQWLAAAKDRNWITCYNVLNVLRFSGSSNTSYVTIKVEALFGDRAVFPIELDATALLKEIVGDTDVEIHAHAKSMSQR